MVKLKVYFCQFLLCIAFSATNVDAITLTTYDNIPDNQLMSPGQTLSGQFNINPQLQPYNEYNIPYNILAGSYEFKFTDDNDLLFDHVYTSEYVYSYTDWDHDKYYYRTRVEYYIDSQYESVNLTISDFSSCDGTDWMHTKTYQGTSFDYSEWIGWSWTYGSMYKMYYTKNYDDCQGYKGNIVFASQLNSGAIADLAVDGILDISMSAYYGDITYNYGKLTFDVEPTPVPEPTTMFLLVSGFIGLAGIRRKFTKA